jgi:uncharacterized membrane protein
MSNELAEKEIEEGKFFAIISYLSFLCIISLVLKKDNKFALYHAKQGLVLFVFESGSFILTIIPILGGIVRTLGLIVFVFASLWCILQVLMGNYNRLPVVSEVADKITI